MAIEIDKIKYQSNDIFFIFRQYSVPRTPKIIPAFEKYRDDWFRYLSPHSHLTLSPRYVSVRDSEIFYFSYMKNIIIPWAPKKPRLMLSVDTRPGHF